MLYMFYFDLWCANTTRIHTYWKGTPYDPTFLMMIGQIFKGLILRRATYMR